MSATRITSLLAAASLLFLAATPAQANVSEADLARPAGGEWLHINGSYDANRFSTLTHLTADNAGDLDVKWIYSVGGETDMQASPLYHDGLLYLPQDNMVHAVEARSGNRVWKYDWELPEDWGGQFVPFFTGKHKGVGIHGDNIYFITNECTIVALNAKSGEEVFTHKIDRPYPKDFEAADDSNGVLLHLWPHGGPRRAHRADERHRHRRPAGIRARS